MLIKIIYLQLLVITLLLAHSTLCAGEGGHPKLTELVSLRVQTFKELKVDSKSLFFKFVLDKMVLLTSSPDIRKFYTLEEGQKAEFPLPVHKVPSTQDINLDSFELKTSNVSQNKATLEGVTCALVVDEYQKQGKPDVHFMINVACQLLDQPTKTIIIQRQVVQENHNNFCDFLLQAHNQHLIILKACRNHSGRNNTLEKITILFPVAGDLMNWETSRDVYREHILAEFSKEFTPQLFESSNNGKLEPINENAYLRKIFSVSGKKFFEISHFRSNEQYLEGKIKTRQGEMAFVPVKDTKIGELNKQFEEKDWIKQSIFMDSTRIEQNKTTLKVFLYMTMFLSEPQNLKKFNKEKARIEIPREIAEDNDNIVRKMFDIRFSQVGFIEVVFFVVKERSEESKMYITKYELLNDPRLAFPIHEFDQQINRQKSARKLI